MHTTIKNKLVNGFKTGVSTFLTDDPLDDLVAKFREGIEAYDGNTSIDAVEDISGLISISMEMGRNCRNTQSAVEYGYEIAGIVDKSAVPFDEWSLRYQRLTVVADKLRTMRHARAERLANEAGLAIPQLHNALVGREWNGVNYEKARQAKAVLDTQFAGTRYVIEWDRHVRAYGDNIEPR